MTLQRDDPRLNYVLVALNAARLLEEKIPQRYGDNWRLRMERESPGVWCCHWDVLTSDGDVLGGGSESFTVDVGKARSG